MIDSILKAHGLAKAKGLTLKAALSALLVVMAVALPQIVHIYAGAAGGMTYLPMYLPVILGGLLLGWKWGLGIGLLSPIVSFLITSATGNAMPALARLPYMVFELAVFAGVSGAFSKPSAKNPLFAFAGALAAVVLGRLSFLAAAYIFESVGGLSGSLIWSQILQSWPGMLISVVGLPLLSLLLYPFAKDRN